MTQPIQVTGERASDYDEIGFIGQYLLAKETINEHLNVKQIDRPRVVDFGCGAGKSSFGVAQAINKNGEIIGIDVSDNMITRAVGNKARFNNACPNIQFDFLKIGGTIDAPEFPIADQYADRVVSSIVFQELQTQKALRGSLEEIFRILKRGGEFHGVFVSDKIIDEDFTAFSYADFPQNRRNFNRQKNFRICRTTTLSQDIVWGRDRHWSARKLKHAIGRAGFAELKIDYIRPKKGLNPFPNAPARRWKDELITPPLMIVSARKH